MTCRTWYNGWVPAQRNATIPIQAAARRDGRLPVFRRCCLCGVGAADLPPDHFFTLHNEDYDRPLDGFPTCRNCHRLIHLRFSDPARWFRYLARVDGASWGRLLSVDPITQFRPFEQSYPDGLDPIVIDGRYAATSAASAIR